MGTIVVGGSGTSGTTIKGVQRGTTAISAGSTSNTASITSVTTTKSIANFLGSESANYKGGVTLTNSTTVTVISSNTGTTRNVSWEIVEFN